MNKTISKQHLTDIAITLLKRSGFSAQDAEIAGPILVWSDLCGRYPQGVFRIPVYVEMLQHGLITSPTEFKFQVKSPSITHLDAGNGFGHIAGDMAMKKAVDIAKTQGVGMVTVNNSNHFGSAGYFCSLAAQSGCLGLVMTNAAPKVAPHGGKTPIFGTNPIAFGAPTDDDHPILADLSTAAFTGSAVRVLKESGGKLPEGVALNEQGIPTTDPADIKSGTLLPAAGPKGSGLGLMVEIFSAILSGAGMSFEVGSYYTNWQRDVNLGHVFLAFHIEDFLPIGEYLQRTGLLVQKIKGSTPLGDAHVRYPGEIRGEIREEQERDGIRLPEESALALGRLAEKLGTSISWRHN